MKIKVILLATLCGSPVMADGHASGDAIAGEKAYRQCQSCHEIVGDDGTIFVRGGNTGPNLWDLPGRVAGTQSEFEKYKKSIVAAGEAGLVWDEAAFASFVQDPSKFLKEFSGDSKARSGMSFRLRNADDALNIWAYIASVSPEPES